MSLLSNKLPSSACISCLPEFGKMMAVPTAIGALVTIAFKAPEMIKQGQVIKKQITDMVIATQQENKTKKKVGET